MKFKKLMLIIKNFFANAKQNAFELPEDEQTILCLEAARLSIDHIVNF